jgi:hypothetical protein
VDASVTFHFEDGAVEFGTHHQGGDTPMTRVDRLSAGELLEYEGDYYSEEIDMAYEIRFDVDDGKLKVYNVRIAPLALAQDEEDEFTASFGSLVFARSSGGAITGFTADNARTRDVWFARR